MNEEKMKELEELLEMAEPLIKLLEERYNPYVSIVVNMDGVSIVSCEGYVPKKPANKADFLRAIKSGDPCAPYPMWKV